LTFRTLSLPRLPIDSAGELLGSGQGEGPFEGVVDLAQRLSQSSVAAECFAQMWWVYATQREPTQADACAIQRLGAAFETADLDVRELLVALIKSEDFRFRSAHLIPPNLTEPPAPTGSATGLAERRRLVLDFVMQEMQAFIQSMPMEDRPQLDQYLTSLRELELKLAAVQLP
jgi:hypothetical protein